MLLARADTTVSTQIDTMRELHAVCQQLLRLPVTALATTTTTSGGGEHKHRVGGEAECVDLAKRVSAALTLHIHAHHASTATMA